MEMDRETAEQMSPAVTLVYLCVLGITEARKWDSSGIGERTTGRPQVRRVIVPVMEAEQQHPGDPPIQ